MTPKTAFTAWDHVGRLCSTSSAGVWILECVRTTALTHTLLLSAPDPKPNLSSSERLAEEPKTKQKAQRPSSKGPKARNKGLNAQTCTREGQKAQVQRPRSTGAEAKKYKLIFLRLPVNKEKKEKYIFILIYSLYFIDFAEASDRK
jgi:hypothetical protein